MISFICWAILIGGKFTKDKGVKPFIQLQIIVCHSFFKQNILAPHNIGDDHTSLAHDVHHWQH